MATFDITGRHGAIFRVTDDVSGAHTINNKLGSAFYAGTIVKVTRGNAIIEHLDAETMVEVPAGGSVTVDPTAVSGAVGVGFAARENQMESTVVTPISSQVSSPRAKAK
jgi:hypothetical protein